MTKRDARGMPLSPHSQPGLVAEMLQLLALKPGGDGGWRAPLHHWGEPLKIPDAQRVSVVQHGQLAVGLIDRKSSVCASPG